MSAVQQMLMGAGGGATDPYYANVSLLLHMDGSNGSTTFTDNSPAPKTVTANGGAQVNTSIVKYGTGSSYFNGINAYLSTPRSSSFIPDANEDFTMEAWVYLTATPSSQSAQIFGLHNYGNSSDYFFMIDSSLRVALYINTGLQYFVNTATPLTLNSWYHVAVSRYGTGSNNMAIYVNGVGQSFTTNIGFAGFGSNPFTIGSDNPGTGSIFTGYIDDVRITKGVARYTANFTPPTGPFPNS